MELTLTLQKCVLLHQQNPGSDSVSLMGPMLKDWQFNKKANITSEMAGCFSEVEKGLPGATVEGQEIRGRQSPPYGVPGWAPGCELLGDSFQDAMYIGVDR